MDDLSQCTHGRRHQFQFANAIFKFTDALIFFGCGSAELLFQRLPCFAVLALLFKLLLLVVAFELDQLINIDTIGNGF